MEGRVETVLGGSTETGEPLHERGIIPMLIRFEELEHSGLDVGVGLENQGLRISTNAKPC